MRRSHPVGTGAHELASTTAGHTQASQQLPFLAWPGAMIIASVVALVVFAMVISMVLSPALAVAIMTFMAFVPLPFGPPPAAVL
jgi:hypothetical protein